MITANGIGSGLDIDSIVTQLMAIEREPVERLQQRRAALDVELSAYGTVRSAMDTLATASAALGDGGDISAFQAVSSDETLFTATASNDAVSGQHDIDVLALATAHRLASDPFASADESIGDGRWTFAAGDGEFEVVLPAGADSLTGLRDMINDAPDNDIVDASLLRTDDGARLILTARRSGIDNEITATRPSLIGNVDAPFTEVTAAADASLTIDGFTVSSADNVIADALAGVELTLLSTGEGSLDTLRDGSARDEALTTFTTEYNALVDGLRGLANDALQGDRLPRNAEAALRTVFNTDLELSDGSRVSPYDLGFSFDRYGALSIVERPSGGLSLDAQDTLTAFAHPETGFAARIATVLDGFTDAGERLDVRGDGIERRQATLDRQIERYDYRLEQTETRYRRQFAAMDALVGQLQSTSSYLADRLGGGAFS